MHFINVSTVFLLLNAVVSTVAVSIPPQATALEARTPVVPMNVAEIKASIVELQKHRQMSENGRFGMPMQYWDKRIKEMNAHMAKAMKQQSKGSALKARAVTPLTLAEIKGNIRDLKRFRKQSLKYPIAPPSYWDGKIAEMRKLKALRLEEMKKQPNPAALKARAVTPLTLAEIKGNIKDLKRFRKQSLKYPIAPPSYWDGKIAEMRKLKALRLEEMKKQPNPAALKARAVTPMTLAQIKEDMRLLKDLRKISLKLPITPPSVWDRKLAEMRKLKLAVKESQQSKPIALNARAVTPTTLAQIRETLAELKEFKQMSKYMPIAPPSHWDAKIKQMEALKEVAKKDLKAAKEAEKAAKASRIPKRALEARTVTPLTLDQIRENIRNMIEYKKISEHYPIQPPAYWEAKIKEMYALEKAAMAKPSLRERAVVPMSVAALQIQRQLHNFKQALAKSQRGNDPTSLPPRYWTAKIKHQEEALAREIRAMRSKHAATSLGKRGVSLLSLAEIREQLRKFKQFKEMSLRGDDPMSKPVRYWDIKIKQLEALETEAKAMRIQRGRPLKTRALPVISMTLKQINERLKILRLSKSMSLVGGTRLPPSYYEAKIKQMEAVRKQAILRKQARL